MVLNSDKIRLRKMLSDSITVLCRAGLPFQSKVQVEALIGITLDDSEVVLLSFKETMASNGLTLSSELVEDDDAEDRDCFATVSEQNCNPTSVTIKDERTDGEWDAGEHKRPNHGRRRIDPRKFRRVDDSGDGERAEVGANVEHGEMFLATSATIDGQCMGDGYDRFEGGSSANDNQSGQNFSDEGLLGFRTQMKVEADDAPDDNADDCMIVKSEEPDLRPCYEAGDNQPWSGSTDMFDGSGFHALGVPGDEMPSVYNQDANWMPQLSKPAARKFKVPSQPRRQTWMTKPSSTFTKSRNYPTTGRTRTKPIPEPDNNEAPENSLGTNVIGRPVMQCAYCSAVFNKSHVLKEHVNGVHFKKKLFHCPDCGESFKWRAELSRHRRVPGICPCRGGIATPDWPSQV